MKKRGVSFLEMLAMELKVRPPAAALLVCPLRRRCLHARRSGMVCVPAAAAPLARPLVLAERPATLRQCTWGGSAARGAKVNNRVHVCVARARAQAEGKYVARGLSFRDAEFFEMEAELTPEQASSPTDASPGRHGASALRC